jgi:hypothetical protein
MSGATGFGLALAGFAALALGQQKHHRAAFAGRHGGLLARISLRQHALIGWILLAAATAWYCVDYQIGYGLTVLAAVLTIAGWIVAVLLDVRPQLVPWLPILGLAFTGVTLVASAAQATAGAAFHG